MKNLMLFIHPDKDFLPEQKTSIKIEIDNSLDLGWKRKDIILATNFPYEYNGVKSILVSDDNYCAFCPTVSCTNVIVELFERNLIEKGTLYWFHDTDVYQLYKITQSELGLDNVDMAVSEFGSKIKLSAGSIFFKESAKDIFRRIKELSYKYQIDEECALNTLYTNNLLWAIGSQRDAQEKFVPFNIKGSGNVQERIKKLNVSYDFETGYLNQQHYPLSTKPIKTAHFHFMRDHLLDCAMYGKNSLKKVLLPKRLIKIFHRHGVKGAPLKKMKNLMVYISPEKRFLGETEDLVKQQIDNSLSLSWKKKDIILITNFPYEYQGVKTVVLDDGIFQGINEKAHKSNVIFHLLDQGIVKEAELWWYHDLNVFQLKPLDSSQIDLEDTFAGFMDDGTNKQSLRSSQDLKLDTGSIFFRKESDKIFEWMRNRTIRLRSDEAAALMSLTETNYRNINTKYKKLDGKKMATIFSKREINEMTL